MLWSAEQVCVTTNISSTYLVYNIGFVVYVDDIFVVTQNKTELKNFYHEMNILHTI